MKLKYFSEQTLPRAIRGGGNSTIARVTFGAKGTIAFNRIAAQLMGLKKGDKLSLGQEEQDPENWYFFKDPQHGFEIRQNKASGWLFNHALLIQAFLDSRNLQVGKSVRAMIAGQPTILKGDKAETKYWGILIRPTV